MEKRIEIHYRRPSDGLPTYCECSMSEEGVGVVQYAYRLDDPLLAGLIVTEDVVLQMVANPTICCPPEDVEVEQLYPLSRVEGWGY